MNFNNFKFIIIDLGNVEYIDDRVQDEIMIRNYRPPENIISEYYDYKADMWCLIISFLILKRKVIVFKEIEVIFIKCMNI